jgi:hypothetical protein
MSDEQSRTGVENSPGENVPPPNVTRGKSNEAGGEDHSKPAPDHDDPTPEVDARPPNDKGPPPDAASVPIDAKPNAKKLDLKLVSGGAPEDIFNDVEALRKVAELKVQRRTVAINMEVRKPPDNGYTQCHPDPVQRIDASLVYDKEERDVYFVHPVMMNHPLILPRLRRMTIATAFAWPSGAIFLWPVPFPDDKGRIKVWKSARRAFEISCGLATDLDPPGPRWVQMVWNAGNGDYDVATAEGINAQPLWPANLSLGDSLKLGFAEKTIASDDHPYVRQLRGLT